VSSNTQRLPLLSRTHDRAYVSAAPLVSGVVPYVRPPWKLFRLLLGFSPLRSDFRRRLVVTWLMQPVLSNLVLKCEPFPIQTSHRNIEALLEVREHPNGVVPCSIHHPFVRLLLRCLAPLRALPTAVVAESRAIVNGRYSIDGLEESVPGLEANRDVLVKVRTILDRCRLCDACQRCRWKESRGSVLSRSNGKPVRSFRGTGRGDAEGRSWRLVCASCSQSRRHSRMFKVQTKRDPLHGPDLS
jgi:hypothetical protein